MGFWTNPEFVRHRRAELRSARLLTVAAITAVICVLVWLACWSSRQQDMAAQRWKAAHYGKPTADQLAQMEQRNLVEIANLFYHSMIFAQLGILTFWALFACAQSVSGERERKTWDFQRATRLKPAELLIGKVLGEPVLAYFITLCCLPITLAAGLVGQVRFLDMLSAYLLIFSAALFIGLTGLWLSHLFDSRSRGVGVIGTFGLYVFLLSATKLRETDLPGLAGFSPLTSLLGAEGAGGTVATLFGTPIPWVLMSLLLYAAFGVWLVLMLLRNLKRDYGEMRLLSCWQAVGCVAFLNFVTYATFHPKPWSKTDSYGFTTYIVMVNAAILFSVGLATLTSYQRLKVWWRERAAKRASLLDEDGLPWPWLVVSALVAYLMLVVGLSALKPAVPYETRSLARGAVQLLAVLIFVTRDILFIQWCRLTRMRGPVMKGILYLGLYYAATLVVVIVVGVTDGARARTIWNVLTPAGVLVDESSRIQFPASIYLGMIGQLATVGILLGAINLRLKRLHSLPA